LEPLLYAFVKMASTISEKIAQNVNKKRDKMSKKVMDVVANQMSCNHLHDPSSLDLSPPRLSSMASTGLEFEAEIMWDYFDLDRVNFLNAGQEKAGSTS